MHASRVLYVGYSRKLLQHLTNALNGCEVVRTPGGLGARILIESKIDYALFLLDEQLPGMKGGALALFARGLRHRKQTPIVIAQRAEGCGELAERIRHMLAGESPCKTPRRR